MGTLDFWRKRRQERIRWPASDREAKSDVGEGVASGSRLVAVEIAGLQESAAGGGVGGSRVRAGGGLKCRGV